MAEFTPLHKSKKLRETEKAYFVVFYLKESNYKVERYIPKSQSFINKVGQVCVKDWLVDNILREAETERRSKSKEYKGVSQEEISRRVRTNNFNYQDPNDRGGTGHGDESYSDADPGL